MKLKFKPDIQRLTVIAVAAFIALAAVLLSGLLGRESDQRYMVFKGKVLSVDNSDLAQDVYVPDLLVGSQQLSVKILDGKYKGEVYVVFNTISRAFPITAEDGMTMLFRIREDDSGSFLDIDMYGYDRSTVIYGLVIVFAGIICLVGRKKGLYAVISLAFTIIIIIYFLIPLMLSGFSPVLAAVITAAVTTAVTILLVSGFNKKSLAALSGIVVGVTLAGITSYAVGAVGHMSSLIMQEAEEMLFLSREYGLKVSELLFCGIIISSLGAIMDVGMSIASSVFEVHQANESLGAKALYKSGMNVGRDVMGTMSNTLILAFAGGSINTMILIILYKLPYIRLINLDLLGLELLQGISGSIGVILTVPVTALFAALLAKKIRTK